MFQPCGESHTLGLLCDNFVEHPLVTVLLSCPLEGLGAQHCCRLALDFAGKPCQRRMPLLLTCCSARTEVDAQRPEFRGATGLRRATEDVRLPGDLEVNEACSHDRGLQFCFQQSTGNSARP